MKKIIKKYRVTILLTAMFIFSLHINAVFEGRNEKLQEYTSVRNDVEIEPFNVNQKATGTSLGDYEQKEGYDTLPVSDAPWFILMLGFGYGVVLLRKRTMVKCS